MRRDQGYYSLIQYSAEPERFEFVNVGIAILCPHIGFFGSKFVKSFQKIDKVFGKQSKIYIQTLISAFANRLMLEFSNNFQIEKFDHFGALRANNFRMTKSMPILIEEPEKDLLDLFDRLVGDHTLESRGTSAITKLKKAFEIAGVMDMVDVPEPVEIEEFDVSIHAPFAYQNGAYNLIDTAKFGSKSEDAFKLASKKAVSGQLLNFNSNAQKKLIIVGDFDEQKSAISPEALEKMFHNHTVKFYALNNLAHLFDDIRKNAAIHR